MGEDSQAWCAGMTNIFDMFAESNDTDDHDSCAHCGGEHLNQDCTTPRTGFYLDPDTGDTYEASKFGYYEQIHSTNYGDVRGVIDSRAIKFKDAPQFLPKEHFATGSDYIDLHELTTRKGLDLTWLMNKLQERGVNLNEGPPGILAPGPIPLAVHQSLVVELEAGIHQAPTPQALALAMYAQNVVTSEYVQATCPVMRKPELNIVTNEDGEVLNIQDVYEALGLDDQRVLEKLGIVRPEQYRIYDRDSANWFITIIRAMQSKADRIAEMAASGIQEQLRYMSAMLYRYGPELKDYNASILPLKKDGSYRQKNVKYEEGAVYFRKGGGWAVTDYGELQAWADSLPNYQHKYREALEAILNITSEPGVEKIAQAALDWKSPIDDYPINIVRKVDKRKILKTAEQGAKIPGVTKSDVKELQVMSIGGTKAWSLKKLKESLVLKTDQYKLLNMADDDTEGATNEDNDVDTN